MAAPKVAVPHPHTGTLKSSSAGILTQSCQRACLAAEHKSDSAVATLLIRGSSAHLLRYLTGYFMLLLSGLLLLKAGT